MNQELVAQLYDHHETQRPPNCTRPNPEEFYGPKEVVRTSMDRQTSTRQVEQTRLRGTDLVGGKANNKGGPNTFVTPVIAEEATLV